MCLRERFLKTKENKSVSKTELEGRMKVLKDENVKETRDMMMKNEEVHRATGLEPHKKHHCELKHFNKLVLFQMQMCIKLEFLKKIFEEAVSGNHLKMNKWKCCFQNLSQLGIPPPPHYERQCQQPRQQGREKISGELILISFPCHF